MDSAGDSAGRPHEEHDPERHPEYDAEAHPEHDLGYHPEHDPLDPASEHGRVYRALVRTRQGSAAVVAADAGVAPERVARVLAELGELGAAARLPGGDGDRWEARPPDALLEARVRAEEHRLAELRS
ncbi:MAG TPA: hypothetical protein VGL02_13305, partial [Streptomyces sp.]